MPTSNESARDTGVWGSGSSACEDPRRHVLERAVAQVAKEATAADDLVDLAATSERADVILAAKRLRLELLDGEAAIERELATFAPNCRARGLSVHWVSGLGARLGRWAHAEPAPHGEPIV